MRLPIKSVVLLALMLVSAFMTAFLTPTPALPDPAASPNLELAVPKAFGDWKFEPQAVAVVVDPQVTEKLNKIYSGVLSRSYINSQGNRLMLSIAYGPQQDKQSQVHRPEVCYPAQGFAIRHKIKEQIFTPYVSIPAQRLVATLDNRIEPITYWIRVGDDLASGWIGQKIAIIKQGVRGRVADGLLFRVSSLTGDSQLAYAMHDKFIIDLLKATAPEDRYFFVGRP